MPVKVNRDYTDNDVLLVCPFLVAGYPPPVCTWSKFDSNNVSHQLQFSNRQLSLDHNNCTIRLVFGEDDNGLYQCTGYNEVGNATYTFPERFIVESKHYKYLKAEVRGLQLGISIHVIR